MNDCKKILYGVSDYARIRRENGWFIDRTDFIRDLEAVPYAMFLRPRRFGKSLLVSILQAYYDVNYANRFDELFSGTKIGERPTGARSSYLVLDFDFSAVDKIPSKVQTSFDRHCSLRIDAFLNRYKDRIPEETAQTILEQPNCFSKLDAIRTLLVNSGLEIYVLIDEYDNFANTILAESGVNAYNDLTHGDGFFKQFFTVLKAATTGLESPVKRMFITGVSPVTMDDVTSGFNIATNVSLDPSFADLTGFTHEDLREICGYYAPIYGFEPEDAFNRSLEWYDNCRFILNNAPSVANTTLVLSLFSYLSRFREFPEDFVDENLRTDYAKVKHLVTLDQRLNGNFHVLEKLLSEGSLQEPLKKSFQAIDLSQKENFTSLLYWFGITTISGTRFGTTTFALPNATMRRLASEMLPAAYADVHKIDERVYNLNNALTGFAQTGQWKPIADILAEVIAENFKVRDTIDGESVVRSSMVTLLNAAKGPYQALHEREANLGFYDIALAPRLETWPEIDHAALIELKYIKAGDDAPSSDALATIRREAATQLTQYASDHDLATLWQLKGECSARAHVTLHKLIVVFHGGKMVMAEEV